MRTFWAVVLRNGGRSEEGIERPGGDCNYRAPVMGAAANVAAVGVGGADTSVDAETTDATRWQRRVGVPQVPLSFQSVYIRRHCSSAHRQTRRYSIRDVRMCQCTNMAMIQLGILRRISTAGHSEEHQLLCDEKHPSTTTITTPSRK